MHLHTGILVHSNFMSRLAKDLFFISILFYWVDCQINKSLACKESVAAVPIQTDGFHCSCCSTRHFIVLVKPNNWH